MFTMGLAQCGRAQSGTAVQQVQTFVRLAVQSKVELLVFPEALMRAGRSETCVASELAEPLDGPLVMSASQVARSAGTWLVLNLFEKTSDEELPYNTSVVLDASGDIRGLYRKCHLYDAHGIYESHQMAFGQSVCTPIRTPFCTLGLGTCYDLRFPELARRLALDGAEVLVFPAAWHAGPHKDLHWNTLLRARAIENECFVAGVCRAGARYVGQSVAFDPLGRCLAQGPAGTDGASGEVLVCCDIDVDTVQTARDAMPALLHRRPELYGG